MLHPSVVEELLDAEIAVAQERLGSRVVSIRRSGCLVLADIAIGVIALDGARYDSEPYAVTFVDGNGVPLPGSAWPAGLNHGEHPILKRPFLCIRGTAEYHTHPSHLQDRWDVYRGRITLVSLLDHICRRAGR